MRALDPPSRSGSNSLKYTSATAASGRTESDGQHPGSGLQSQPLKWKPPVLECGLSIDRLKAKLLERIKQDENECWVWQKKADLRGYGQFTVRTEHYRAHRVAYEIFVGPIPERMTIDHLCQVKLCCNPAHLEPVSAQENTKRHFASKTHCRKGHELTPQNVRTSETKPGRRDCLTCERLTADRKRKKVSSGRGITNPLSGLVAEESVTSGEQS